MTLATARPLTHAPDIGFRNRRHKFDARFRCQFVVQVASGTKNESFQPKRARICQVDLSGKFFFKLQSVIFHKFGQKKPLYGFSRNNNVCFLIAMRMQSSAISCMKKSF